LQDDSAKCLEEVMLWDWRLTQTPWSFHQSFSPLAVSREQ
jgi:hypothetical protein